MCAGSASGGEEFGGGCVGRWHGCGAECAGEVRSRAVAAVSVEQMTEIERRDYAWHTVRLWIRNRGTGISNVGGLPRV